MPQKREADKTPRIERLSKAEFIIPIGTEVIIKPVNRDIRSSTVFLGMEVNKFLLLRLPSLNFRQQLAGSNEVTVRFRNGSQIYGFNAQIINITTSPYGLLFLEYPESIEILNLRKDERAYCFLPTTVYWEGADAQGRITDISKSGSKIILDIKRDDTMANISMNAEIFCQFHLEGLEHDLYTKGLVRNADTSGRKLVLGVQFIEPEEITLNNISQYVANVQAYLDV